MSREAFLGSAVWTERPVLAPPFKAGDLEHIPDLSGLWCLICAILGVVRESLGKSLDRGSAWSELPECDKLPLVVVAEGAQIGGREAKRLDSPS